MDDQNNKKGYDDFFNPDNPKRSEDMNESDRVKENETKSSYYYAYGPKTNEPSVTPYRQENNMTLDSSTNTMYGAESTQQQPQLRPFTATHTAGNNGWKVKEKRGTSFKSVFLSFLAGMLVVGGLMYTADVRNWFTSNGVVETSKSGSNGSGATAAESVNKGSTNTAAGRPDNIDKLFQTASPAVVKIETYVNAQSQGGGGSILDDPFFRQFFGNREPEGTTPPQEQGGQMQQVGAGTGFFFDKEGYILTNQHVIGDAAEIKITVQGYDKPFKGELLGSIYELDLAVVKIKGEKEFPTLPLGDSDKINIGDWVVAIGNPYGFDHTITVGVLSAKERPIDIQDANGERNYKHLLQTDASINPGNSGGPLLNLNGEVIGMNTAVSAQAQGIGFAIPTSTIQEVLENLKTNTEVPKPPAPFIGAELFNMTDEFAKELGLAKAEGSIVKNVYLNSPAYLADMRTYDVILGIEGKKIATREELIKEIQSRKVGDKVEFNIIRQGKEMNLVVEIGDRNVFGLE
ncbi:trypsin-like peptidase domain-containing protein [Paenibacillus sp. GSMTC-2017]|uniref:S1C family serine protease n=1 Tax=Paenibacillus sp. GSMTC-2017 TaxID=2794350 RepID=UPI0018D8E813|nr:trypsin-like peptidase domain-containing protein [Paenibacillus sp. GSMTC-2017]MBH5319267.1 trypsin-like peptidase domain-containing protein [Paenibacillus sp. GSMTC-2017]